MPCHKKKPHMACKHYSSVKTASTKRISRDKWACSLRGHRATGYIYRSRTVHNNFFWPQLTKIFHRSSQNGSRNKSKVEYSNAKYDENADGKSEIVLAQEDVKFQAQGYTIYACHGRPC